MSAPAVIDVYAPINTAARVEHGTGAKPRWAGPALRALLAATALFWSIGLGRMGWANAFYAAAVQAGTKSWKAFLFGSSDAGNSITAGADTCAPRFVGGQAAVSGCVGGGTPSRAAGRTARRWR